MKIMKNLKAKIFKNLNISFLSFVVALVLSALAPNNLKADEPIYRLYNSTTLDHLYAKKSEVAALTAKGWSNEGIGWYAPLSGTPVYRLYNAAIKKHLCTTNDKEKDTLLGQGWSLDGFCVTQEAKFLSIVYIILA
jgi:hypothetical protein